ncbi:spore coat protein CotF [Geomicrobium halophilum]|uniref:Spore coat protein CotF n=1 Tax=Geomicrobium halophilum TaxID=549000 RepID=A0A841PZZ0_9BACL|nr:spore coat protein [Geomicrobium halophilum]MBB6450265.1 spore coat protein CotF [Geomicrobium halophilum]
MSVIQSQNIQNPKTTVPETKEMNDKDFITDLLSTEKYMTTSYGTAMNEASHNSLYQDISMVCNESHQCLRELFNTMFQKGWYTLEPAPVQTLQQSYQQNAGMQNQMPSGNMTH